MFSGRLQWDAPTNRLSRRIRARRDAGHDIVDLTVSNPTRAELPYPGPEILETLGRFAALAYDPTPRGARSAREAIAAYYRAGAGVEIDPDDVFLTASTSEAYGYLLKLLADPGDDVAIPAPSYPLLDYLAALDSVRRVPYPLNYHDGWCVDLDALRARVGDRCRAIVAVHPNNPTGSFLKRGEVQSMAELARASKAALVVDEVFRDYPLRHDDLRAGSLAGFRDAPNFVLGGLSKAIGLPQLKLSWIVVGGPDAIRREAVRRLDLVADTYLSVATPVQVALPDLLRLASPVRDAIRQRIRANLDRLRHRIGADSPCSLLDLEGGWYATLRVPDVRSDEDWAVALLDDEGVLVQPGYFYDFPGEACLVLSLLTPEPVFEVGIRRMLAAIAAS